MRKTTKTVLAVVASLTIATGFSTKAEAASHVVKPGETLWIISNQYDTTIANLKSINNLTSNMIYPYQIIETSETQTTNPSTYTVQSGDTLWIISNKHGVSIANLRDWNNLSSDMIYVGQVLNITAESSSKPDRQIASETVINYNAKVAAEAKKHIGTPYRWAGTTPAGFDCSGFIYYVHNQAGVEISRMSSANYYNQATKITSPEPGDLVFFKNTYKTGISHMGIYVGNNSFVHAASSGVKVTSLSNPYWSQHFAGYGSF